MFLFSFYFSQQQSSKQKCLPVTPSHVMRMNVHLTSWSEKWKIRKRSRVKSRIINATSVSHSSLHYHMFITVNYRTIENYSQYEMQQEVLQKKVEFSHDYRETILTINSYWLDWRILFLHIFRTFVCMQTVGALSLDGALRGDLVHKWWRPVCFAAPESSLF